jgi:hypothetical protein
MKTNNYTPLEKVFDAHQVTKKERQKKLTGMGIFCVSKQEQIKFPKIKISNSQTCSPFWDLEFEAFRRNVNFFADFQLFISTFKN